MKQTIFETKQRADELLNKALEIWRKSDQSDRLEDIENDPVVSLLITALAYQANETESELEQMKADVLEEFAQMLTPYDEGHAIPATTVVETALKDDVTEIETDERLVFTLKGSDIGFLPLLRIRVLNVAVESVVRLDGRRWKVSLDFKSPVSDLSGFCFAIRNNHFRDLSVSVKEQILPLIKPWDLSELPLTSCFDIDTVLYNHSQTFMASSLGMDLFACQNIRMFCIKKHPSSKIPSGETNKLDLIFEFRGISEKFLFDKNNLSLNTLPLVNAQIHTVNLSTANPIVRVAGYDSQTAGDTIYGQQFMHMIRPSEEQLYGEVPIEVRRVAADRFNQGALVKLLNNLINKYYSDFYAFQNIQHTVSDKIIHGLRENLSQLISAAMQNQVQNATGIYLMLRPSQKTVNQQITVDVPYVTTLGAAINDLLNATSTFTPPTGFDPKAMKQISTPTPGADEIRDEKSMASMRRYFMTTHDRLVTPADIKLFCYYELQARYGIGRNMVKSITVNHRQQFEKRLSGYEILVEIVLIENAFVKRGFSEKIEQTEILLKSLMNVRSTNIYPIQVIIKLEPEKNKEE